MIFASLWQSANDGELILMAGGLCRWHLRGDGQLTIHEIIVLPQCQRQGIGAAILRRLKSTPGATSIFAKCPADLEANGWYRHLGFEFEGIERTRSGREINLWRLHLPRE